MSENLIYGTDLTSYGAIGDAKSDSSIALNKAIEDRQSLISIPYGNYIFKSPVILKSNLKLSIHPKATLTFDFDKKACACVSATSQSAIIIDGGIWINKSKCDLFCMDNVRNLTLSGFEIQSQTLSSAICLKNTSYVKLKSLTATSQKSQNFIKMSDCSDIVIDCLSADGYEKAICFDGHGNISNIHAHQLHFDNCGTLIYFDKALQCASRIYFSGITGSFFNNALCIVSKTDDITFDCCNVYALSKSDKDPCYLLIDGQCEGLEIIGFNRNIKCECVPPVYTALIRPQTDCTCIIDGLLLDNIIMSKSLSKDISMTAAKLSSPFSKYSYTVELDIKSGQCYTLFSGDFETLSI